MKKLNSSTLDARSFFYENAGFSYDPKKESEEAGRKRCARALADAEQGARNLGYSFDWEPDEIDSSDFSDERPAWGLFVCVMYRPDGTVCGSLSGVDFGRDGSPHADPYRRVVEAELALEESPNFPSAQ